MPSFWLAFTTRCQRISPVLSLYSATTSEFSGQDGDYGIGPHPATVVGVIYLLAILHASNIT